MEDLITIQFIVVQQSQCGFEEKGRKKFAVPPMALQDFCFEENATTAIFNDIGVPSLPSSDKDYLLFHVFRRASSRPSQSDHLYVCVIIKPDKTETNGDHGVLIDKFNIVTGVHVEEEEAISWDLVEEPFNEVLQSCKPPIPCLKKTKIYKGLNEEETEELCCAICLQDFDYGCEAARTNCSHLYHAQCIVKWLMKSSSCPLCRCRLPV